MATSKKHVSIKKLRENQCDLEICHQMILNTIFDIWSLEKHVHTCTFSKPAKLPDEPFHNFRASRSGDRQTLCSSGMSSHGF